MSERHPFVNEMNTRTRTTNRGVKTRRFDARFALGNSARFRSDAPGLVDVFNGLYFPKDHTVPPIRFK